jgi:aerobic carbon-monoxide dehydrogenase medium subunit
VKPVDFQLHRPGTLSETLALLQDLAQDVKVLAGGQSLLPLLNFRLARPVHVVDIGRLTGLTGIRRTARELSVGAMVRHAEAERSASVAAHAPLLAAAVPQIAHPQVRNRGTVGGSLVHADPAADWVNALAAIGAEAIIAGPSGRRTMPVEDLMLGVFEVSLEPSDLLEAIRIPRLSPTARWGYYKVSRKTGEFAHAIGAVLDDPDRGVCRTVIGAIDAKPIVLSDARTLFDGRSGSDLVRSFAPHVADDFLQRAGVADPIDRQIHVAALGRAIRQTSPS